MCNNLLFKIVSSVFIYLYVCYWSVLSCQFLNVPTLNVFIYIDNLYNSITVPEYVINILFNNTKCYFVKCFSVLIPSALKTPKSKSVPKNLN